jgi:hypothetical protein
MPGGEHHRLAPSSSDRQPVAHPLARGQHGRRLDEHVPDPRRSVDRGPRRSFHEIEHPLEPERIRHEAHPETLVVVALKEELDVAAHVVEGVRGPPGHLALQQARRELVRGVRPR